MNDNFEVYYKALLLDPSNKKIINGGIFVKNGQIIDIGNHINFKYKNNIYKNIKYIDIKGNILAPGIVDIRVFTNELCKNSLENISRSAASGGVTTVLIMPNTNSIIDNITTVEFINNNIRKNININLYASAALTKGLQGVKMTEIGLLKKSGAIAFTDGRNSINNSMLFYRILTYAKCHNALIIHDVEDKNLANNGVINEGLLAIQLGLPSKHKIAEIIMLERDLLIASLTGTRYHVSQISCLESLNAIKRIKLNYSNITAGVSINNLFFNEIDIGRYKTFLRFEPPLRNNSDRIAMIKGIKNGDIDVIVSSHDLQNVNDKYQSFEDSSIGGVGLETLLSASLKLYHDEDVDLLTLWKVLSLNPSKLLGLKTGTLKIGMKANFIVVDLNYYWKVKSSKFNLKNINTPFKNYILKGKVLQTYVNGKKIFDLNT